MSEEYYTDAMWDIESMGLLPGVIVTQIGLCLFNRIGSPKMEKFRWNIDGKVQMDAGLKMDFGTISWWMLQSDEARKSVFSGSRVYPSVALGEGASHIRAKCIRDVLCWANSPTFDFALLAPLWKLSKIERPWTYKQEADVRTLKWLAPTVRYREVAVEHDAAEDAEAQALYVRDVFEHLAGRAA